MAYVDDYKAALRAMEAASAAGQAPRTTDWEGNLRSALASAQTAFDTLAAAEPDPPDPGGRRETLAGQWARAKARLSRALPA